MQTVAVMTLSDPRGIVGRCWERRDLPSKKAIEVGSFPANAFGLHDMHGNVWEWVQDCYADSYAKAPTDGSKAPDADGCSRVLRGGSWNDYPRLLRSALRLRILPDYRFRLSGFRLARTLPPAK